MDAATIRRISELAVEQAEQIRIDAFDPEKYIERIVSCMLNALLYCTRKFYDVIARVSRYRLTVCLWGRLSGEEGEGERHANF